MEISYIHRETHSDPSSARLGVLEFSNLSFLVKRVYWLSNFVEGVSRGNHAHKNLNQVMLMIKGRLDLELCFGFESKTIELNEQSDYVLVPAGHWRVMKNASPDAALLVLADSEYRPDDYIRNWDDYLLWFLDKHNER